MSAITLEEVASMQCRRETPRETWWRRCCTSDSSLRPDTFGNKGFFTLLRCTRNSLGLSLCVGFGTQGFKIRLGNPRWPLPTLYALYEFFSVGCPDFWLLL